jgi:hypothetical protein
VGNLSWYLESSLNKWSHGTLHWIGVFSDEIRCVCTSNLSDAMLYFMTKNKNVRNKFPTKISYWHVFTFIFLVLLRSGHYAISLEKRYQKIISIDWLLFNVKLSDRYFNYIHVRTFAQIINHKVNFLTQCFILWRKIKT